MKQVFKLFLVILSVTFFAGDSIGQTPGKIYQLGDTVNIDGLSCLVYKLDETGMHGTALSPFAKTTEKLEKEKKKTIKSFEKAIKKGKATQEELDEWLANFDSQVKIPIITKRKGTKGLVYEVDAWSEKAPQGWRIPTSRDVEDLTTFICGGLGKNNGVTFSLIKKVNGLTADQFARSNLLSAVFYGMIVSDSNNPADVKFLQRFSQTLTMKEWFELKDTYTGNELTFAVKDF